MPNTVTIDTEVRLVTGTAPRSVEVTNVTNQVAVSSARVVVSPVIVNNQVTAPNITQVINAANTQVNLRLVQTSLAVNVQSDTINILAVGIQGPAGPLSNEISVLNKAERKDTEENTPSAGDITQYYGIAAPQSLNANPVWLITKTIFLKDGGAFDSEKLFASLVENQIWDNRLALPYS